MSEDDVVIVRDLQTHLAPSEGQVVSGALWPVEVRLPLTQAQRLAARSGVERPDSLNARTLQRRLAEAVFGPYQLLTDGRTVRFGMQVPVARRLGRLLADRR